MTPLCDYCRKPTERVTGAVMYPKRPDLAEKVLYRCTPCDAWVGCHDGTDNPLGRLANKELRIAKTTAHGLFDPLWEAKMRRDGCSKTQARKAAYRWLAEQLGIDVKDCHIGMFDVATCNRVVRICRAAVRPKRETTDER